MQLSLRSMKMSVNYKLLPVKLHYFFICACVAILLFFPTLARQKGIPPDGVGRIWSLLPIFTITTMMIISNLADRFNSHRISFFAMLVVLFIAEAALCFIPDIPSTQHKINNITEVFHGTLKTMCHQQQIIGVTFDDSETEEQFCQYWNDSQRSSFCNTTCIIQNEKLTKLPDNLLGILSLKCNESVTDVTNQRTFNFKNETQVHKCDNQLDVICNTLCKEDENENVNRSMSEIALYIQFWLLLVALLVFDGSNGISGALVDMAALQLLGEDRNKFGMQRVWGTLGWGIMALVYGAVIDFFSHSSKNRNYTSGIILSMIFFVLTFISSLKIKFLKPKTEKEEAGSILEVVRSANVILFLTCMLVIGISSGCVGVFLFMQMEDVAMAWDPDFQNLNLLQGLCISIGCFFGEVPAMFLSGHIINWLGNIYTFALVLAVYSTRFILYSFITNPWLFLPIEITVGFAFGIFYPNMSAYANKMAPPGRYATMQSLVKCTIDIGTSVGALIGGECYKIFGGPQMFLYVGLADAIFMFFYVACHFLLDRRSKQQPENEEAADTPKKETTTKIQQKC